MSKERLRPEGLSRRALVTRGGLAVAGLAAGAAGLNVLTPAVLPRPENLDANASLWSLALPAPSPSLAGSQEVDVAIIGGGYTGLSTAHYLRERWPRARIALLEAVRCGNGASARNGGMLLTTTADRYLVPGPNAALDRRLHELTVSNIGTLRELAGRIGIDPEIDTRGALHVLLDARQREAARRDVAGLEAAGIPAELWDADRTAAALGTRAYAGAVFNPLGGQVHPGRLLALWRAAADRAGTEIYEGTPVVAVRPGDPVEVHTAAGHTVRARHVVLATNAYGAGLGFLARAAAGLWDYVAATRPLTDEEWATLGWSSRMPFDDGHTEVYYLGLTRDRRVHIGGGPVDYGWNGRRPDAERFAERHAALGRELVRLYPVLAGVPIEYRWAGLVDMSLDESPAVGSLGDRRNLHYAIGFSGHGVNLSSVFGRVLADLVAGDRDSWRWLPYLDRLPPYLPNEPFRWLGIHGALTAVRLSGG